MTVTPAVEKDAARPTVQVKARVPVTLTPAVETDAARGTVEV